MSIDVSITEQSSLTKRKPDFGLARHAETMQMLGTREQFRDEYWQKRDPIYEDRLHWRAQSFRHIVHLLPGQTILELGAGRGLFTKQLHQISRGENQITAVTFTTDTTWPTDIPDEIEHLNVPSLPGSLQGRQFDFVVAMDMLDGRNSAWFLKNVYSLLKPGGQLIFYESNPWNVVLNIRRHISKLFGQPDPRHLLGRTRLYELISEVGFIRVFAVYNDFVYAPLTRPLIWLLRNLSILLENAPFLQTLAGSILIHAQKPPLTTERPSVSLCDHEQLHDAISVVVPCHNEEMNVGPLVKQLTNLFNDYIHEIILVDDNSTDQTAIVIQQLADADARVKPIFRNPPNGVGRALTDGYREATGAYVLSMDCDFQHLLPEIRDLFDTAVQGYDVVIGSRFSRLSVLLNYPFQKILANRAFHTLAQIMLHRRFRDLTNNLKLMRHSVLQKIEFTQPGFAVNAETGLYPLIMGYKVKEVPISWINRTPDMGVSSFRLAQVGGGYWHVLWRLCRKTLLGFRKLPGASAE